MKYVVYGLLDPTDKLLHYIGYTSDPDRRLKHHYYGNEGTKEKQIWIRHLKKNGLKPIMEVFQEYNTAEELPEAEGYWYGYFKMIGAELYNDPSVIGKGFVKGHKMRKCSDETRAKLSAALTGKHLSVEHKANISASNKGRKQSSEEKAKRSATLTGHKTSNATKAKISAALKGKPKSDEHKAKLSISSSKGLLGHKHSDATKAKLSAAKKGKPFSDEHRANLSAALTGRHLSDETKEKMSASRKGKKLSSKTR